jgi:hypothetical protein
MNAIWDRTMAREMLVNMAGSELLSETKKSVQFRFRARVGNGVELDLRNVKSGITVYANQISQSGNRFADDQIGGISVKERYPIMARTVEGKRGIAWRVSELPSLNPEHNEVMRINASGAEPFAQFLAWYTDQQEAPSETSAGLEFDRDTWVDLNLDAGRSKLHRKAISQEDFVRVLERRSEIGKAGEAIAFESEARRLQEVCPAPKDFINHVALDDVGKGYDIETTWPGHERFIEVKSSTRGSNGFYISANERKVLKDLGTKAWIYLVEVGADGTGSVAKRLPDPMHSIPEENFAPIAWRVKLE